MLRDIKHPLRSGRTLTPFLTTGRTRRVPLVRPPASTAIDRWCLDRLVAALPGVAVRCVLWDGCARGASASEAVATVRIHDRPTLLRLLADPDLHFGDAYSAGRLDVEGDLVGFLTAVARVQDWRRQAVPRWRLGRFGGDPRRAAEHVHHHYDIGNDFYRLWLDRDLVYTCAYFPAPEASLEEAQQAKLDYVCQKVGLRRGETVFEAGCGWGALALHMARCYGARVRAWNISSEQVAHARARAEAEGLAGQVEFVLDDYRTIEGRCDVFVSVGMLEHVGPRHYRELGAVIDRTLDRARGRGLLHFIGRDAPAPLNAWITRRVFPGAYPPSLREAIAGVLEPFTFSVTDVENLRLHYARTLAHWLERFERHADAVRGMYDEAFVRTWRLYLAGAQAAFEAGSLQLFQVTFARNGLNDVPWTRAGLYAATGEAGSPARAS